MTAIQDAILDAIERDPIVGWVLAALVVMCLLALMSSGSRD
jgi:hypothetical protein